MLKLINDQLRWSDGDVVFMANLIGAEHALRRKAPFNAALIKLVAKSKYLQLSPKVQKHLTQEVAQRQRVRELHALTDVPARTAFSQRWFPHQRTALHIFDTLDQSGYLLCDQPGVGKTLTAMLWAWFKTSTNRPASRILIIAPNSAKAQWKREIRRWLGNQSRVTVVEGTTPEQITLANADGWVIGHWESLVHARKGYLKRPWDVVIADEAHNMQNYNAQRSRTAFHLDATYRIALTGHPFANAPDELWSILHFLYPTHYTSFWRFFEMHVRYRPKPFGGREILGARRPKLLKWEIAPFTLRRLKKDVFKSLPPILRVSRNVSLTSQGRTEYEKLKREFFVELQAHKNATKILAIPSVLARVTRLRQYLVDPQMLGAKQRSVKFPVIRELMDELDGPPVIFTSFRKAAENLGKFLADAGHVGYITGKQSPTERATAQKRFLRGDLIALIVVTQAGGTALNLGKYGYVIHLDLPWSPKDLEQTEGRVDRPEEGTGKLVPTTAYRIIVEDSYEQRLEAKLETKYDMFKSVFTVADAEALFS